MKTITRILVKKMVRLLKRETRTQRKSKWSDGLPQDLMDLVLNLLPLLDYIHFAAVCSQWRDYQSNHRHHFGPSSFPCLVTAKCLPVPLVYSPSEHRFYDLHLHNSTNQNMKKIKESIECIGLSHGWMILLIEITSRRTRETVIFHLEEEEEVEIAALCLMNPISGRRIQLPHLLSMETVNEWDSYGTISMSCPPTQPGCIVAALFKHQFLLCRVGDRLRKWTTALYSFPWSPLASHLGNPVFCGTKVYYKSQISTDLVVVDPTLLTAKSFLMDERQLASFLPPKDVHIVESNQELLLVVDKLKCDNTVHVFKADLDTKVWVKITRLCDEHVLFLSRGGNCFSSRASQVRCSRGNYIYFSHGDCPERICSIECSRRHLWMSFDMETGRVVRKSFDDREVLVAKENCSILGIFFPHWFVPRLDCKTREIAELIP